MELYQYDVALSFAGEDRDYVKIIAQKLKNNGLKVFYDEFEESNLWGKDLYQYLHHIYKECAHFCIIFVSSNYIKKAWTKHELKAAQNRAFLDNTEYLLPLLLDTNVSLPGLSDTTGYISAKTHTPDQIVELICNKLHNNTSINQEEYDNAKKLYNTIFEIFNYLVDRYTSLGKGSKVAEFNVLELLLSEYNSFLLQHAYEINHNLFDFLVCVLKELKSYITGEHNIVIEEYRVSLLNALNLQHKATILNQLKQAYEESGYRNDFDFLYYIQNHNIIENKDESLLIALKAIANKAGSKDNQQIIIHDYFKQFMRIKYYDDYTNEDEFNTLIKDLLTNDNQLEELQEMLDHTPDF